MPTIVNAAPLALNLLAAVGFLSVSAFTISQVLATAPDTSFSVGRGASASLTKEEYSGIVSWVSSDSIQITDSYGVKRVFTMDESTEILKNAVGQQELKYSDIRAFGHVKVSTLKSQDGEKAQVIIVR